MSIFRRSHFLCSQNNTVTCNRSWELWLLTSRFHILVQGILSQSKIHKDMSCPTVSLGSSSSDVFTSSTLNFSYQTFVFFSAEHYPPGTDIMSAKWLSQALVNLSGSDFSPRAETEPWHKPGQLSEDDSGDLHARVASRVPCRYWRLTCGGTVACHHSPHACLGAKTSFSSRQRTIREKRKKKWSAAKPSWKSQNSIPGSVLPAEQEVWRAPSCLHLFLFPSSPAVVVGEQCWSRCCRRLPPATGAVSAKINARSVTVLCCNALDSSFLALPLAALLPTCFLSPPLTCAQSHMRRHCWSLNTNRLSSLKDVIVPLRLDPPLPLFKTEREDAWSRCDLYIPDLPSSICFITNGLRCLLLFVWLRVAGDN